MHKKLMILLVSLLLLSSNSIAQALPNNHPLAAKYRPGMIATFVKYAKIGSMSSNEAEWMTPGQEKMANVLYKDIAALGLPVHLSKDKYIYVNIPSNIKNRAVPTLGISAHYDTTPDIIGENIQPQIIARYDGKPIHLKNGVIIDPVKDTYLNRMVGKTIVTSDGTTNLGADDKAGVTIVFTLLKTLAENKDLPHGPIQVVITPNEDIGRSAERLDLKYYKPDFAFDFDGGVDGEVVIANFSADKVIASIEPTGEKQLLISLIATGINGHQSKAPLNGYRNGPKPLADLLTFAVKQAQSLSSCRITPAKASGELTTYDAAKNTHTAEFLVRCHDPKQQASYASSLQKEVSRVRKEAKIPLQLEITELDVYPENAAFAMAELASLSTKTENLPQHSGPTGKETTPEEIKRKNKEPYNELHHMTSFSLDNRHRYFDKKHGESFYLAEKHIADSLNQALGVAIRVQRIKQYENVEYGVKPQAKVIITKALAAAGVTPDIQEKRSGTTSAMIMAQHGFGGYTVFTGQNNPHSFTEWLSEEDMFKSYLVALNLINAIMDDSAPAVVHHRPGYIHPAAR